MVTIVKRQNSNMWCATCKEVIGLTKDDLWNHLETCHDWSKYDGNIGRNAHTHVDGLLSFDKYGFTLKRPRNKWLG